MDDKKTQKSLASSWINKQLIETALNDENSGTKIRVEKAVIVDNEKEGLGYTSNILRVAATVRRENAASCDQVHLVVKYAQDQGKLKEIADDNNVFRKESLLLCEIFPEVHRLLESAEGDAFRPLAARCFLSGRQPVEFLLMEDLSAAGFRLPPAGRAFDYRHCAAALRAYARQHAASARLLRDRPDYRARSELRSKMAEAEKSFFKDMLDKVMKNIAREFRTIPGYERNADKCEHLAGRSVDRMADFWTSTEVTLPVVIHCDCWKNNFMFRYDGESVTDVRILDFQMSRVHSPAADVVSFLYVNASEEVHRRHLPGLLSLYHGALQDTLRALGLRAEADAYPLGEFQRDVDWAHVLAVFNSAVRGMVLTSEENGADFANFFDNTDESGEVLAKACRHPDCVSYLKYVIPLFEKKGLL
ncbi:uncharacterized protein LOC126236837 [Schistocerca nitens]|uniref:uncharacterized protein LOC126236837 n=1 Tax=Schistocerca nitens TaxID=7011 RepID=UPI00211855E2|nr:uncharacterized protein LOC126236837 [Schistocerca nitens]